MSKRESTSFHKAAHSIRGKPLRETFKSKYSIDPVTGCWIWIACKDKDGYGLVQDGRKVRRAHRVSYEMFVSEDLEGKILLHSCDNPSCVNPSHLKAGSHSDNQRDASLKCRHASQRLTPTQVIDIRAKFLNGERNKDLAKEYGITTGYVTNIIQRKKWAHI